MKCARLTPNYHAPLACRAHIQVIKQGALALPGRRRTLCRAETVSGDAYEDIIDTLARRALSRAEAAPSGRVVVGVAGAPGSGKSTLATAVASQINLIAAGATAGASTASPAAAGGGAAAAVVTAEGGSAGPGQGPGLHAVVLPMDGFHYYRRELDAMPDPQEAHARRGAPWTFNATKFVEAVRQVRQAARGGGGGGSGDREGAAAAVRVPSFDHGVGDPVEEDIAIPPEAAVVLVEGNYVLLEEEPWAQLRGLFDEAWFVDCPVDVAMDRVFQRQVGLGLAPEVSRVRIATNDRPNAELVAASAARASLLVPSTVPFRRAQEQ